MTRALLAAVAVLAVVSGCGGAHGLVGQRIDRSTPLADFALHDQDGRIVSLSSLRGRYVIVSFLYTHCVDVCPLIAENVSEAIRDIGPADDVRALAVSVDPGGDSAAAVATFMRVHRTPPGFRYLRGSLAELRPVWQEFNVLVERRSAIRISHDAPIFVVDPTGRPALLYPSQVTAASMAADLRRLDSAP